MRSEKESILGLIGLSQKAGKTAAGSNPCELAIKTGKAELVIMAEDTSAKTKEPIAKLCGYHDVPIREFATKEELGRFTGKPIRAALAITDSGLAKRILELIDIMESNKK
jgi:ribosomal protein L7Ae-like RNA K-turn-binding protein